MDMKVLEKLMEKKKDKKELDPAYKKAKMSGLKSLHSEMGKLMGEDVGSLKKVTVAAPDNAGLAAGLEKAEELVEGTEDAEDGEEAGDEVAQKMDAYKTDPSPENLAALMECLNKKKEMMA